MPVEQPVLGEQPCPQGLHIVLRIWKKFLKSKGPFPGLEKVWKNGRSLQLLELEKVWIF